MKVWKTAAAAIALAAIGSTGAFAQSPDENSDTSQKPPTMAPSTTPPSGEGASTGERRCHVARRDPQRSDNK